MKIAVYKFNKDNNLVYNCENGYCLNVNEDALFIIENMAESKKYIAEKVVERYGISEEEAQKAIDKYLAHLECTDFLKKRQIVISTDLVLVNVDLNRHKMSLKEDVLDRYVKEMINEKIQKVVFSGENISTYSCLPLFIKGLQENGIHVELKINFAELTQVNIFAVLKCVNSILVCFEDGIPVEVEFLEECMEGIINLNDQITLQCHSINSNNKLVDLLKLFAEKYEVNVNVTSMVCQDFGKNYKAYEIGDYTKKVSKIHYLTHCKSCGVGVKELAIGADGVLYPCDGFLYNEDFGLGNSITAYKSSIRHKEYQNLSTQLIQKCNECDISSICGGGCRALAYYTNENDLYAHEWILCEARKSACLKRMINACQIPIDYFYEGNIAT